LLSRSLTEMALTSAAPIKGSAAAILS